MLVSVLRNIAQDLTSAPGHGVIHDGGIHVVAIFEGVTLALKRVDCGACADRFTVVVPERHDAFFLLIPTLEQVICVALAEIDPAGPLQVNQSFGTILKTIQQIFNAIILEAKRSGLSETGAGDLEQLCQCCHDVSLMCVERARPACSIQ